jgi:1-acyl-sn-glycerol-3-phosphate acyltransferase
VSPPPRIVRRVVVDPLFLLLAVPLAALLGLVVWGAALLGPLTPRRRVQRVARFALAYLRLDVGLVLTGFRLWLRRPLHTGPGGHRRWTEAHCALLRDALVELLEVARKTGGFRLEVDPEAFPPPTDGRPLVVLARHAGPGDSFSLVWLLLDRLGRTPRVVLKDVLLWDPGLDVVLTRLAGCFLSSRSGAGDDNADRVAALARDLGPDDALLLFPEGGNWTPGRQRRAVRRLGRAGHRRAARKAAARPALLPPRPTGTAAVLGARPDADVLVVAHGGLDRLAAPGAVWRALPFDGTPMRVHWWPVPREEVPHRADDVPAWLDGQWDRIAAWLSRPARAGRRG